MRLLVDHDTLWECPEDNCAVVGPVGNAVIPFNAVGVGFDEPILVTTGAEVVVTGAEVVTTGTGVGTAVGVGVEIIGLPSSSQTSPPVAG